LLRFLLLALALTLGAAPLLAEQKITPEQLDALKKRINSIDQWLAGAEKDRSDLEKQLTAIDRRISELTRERRSLGTRAREQQQRLSELEQQEAELARSLEQQRETLKQQVRAAWMEGHTPALKVLLNEADPGKIARTMTYYQYLSRDTVQRLEAFQRKLQELSNTRSKVRASRVELARTEENLEQRQQQLAESRARRQQTLVALNQDIRTRRNERQNLEADHKRLQKLLEEVQEAIASIPAPNESSPFQSMRNKLPWPARGRIVANYGASYADGKLRRNGIIVNTAEEAEIKAVHYGRVVFANWLRGFGLMTIIDHGDGYLSLYGHSSSLFTEPGDWVSPGETIALAGRTGGTEDPAVYFEVRQKGKPVNPRSWLGKR